MEKKPQGMLWNWVEVLPYYDYRNLDVFDSRIHWKEMHGNLQTRTALKDGAPAVTHHWEVS